MTLNPLTDPTIPAKNRVKALMQLKGITMAEIARELNISVPAVSEAISATQNSYRVMRTVAEKLGVSLDELSQWYGREFKPKSKQKKGK